MSGLLTRQQHRREAVANDTRYRVGGEPHRKKRSVEEVLKLSSDGESVHVPGVKTSEEEREQEVIELSSDDESV